MGRESIPQKELAMLDSPEKYKKGVAFYAARSTFFLPEEEMTEEELADLMGMERDSEEMDELIRRIFERKGWDYEED